MASLTKNTDYLGEGRKRLPERFKDKPRIDALLQAWLGEAQRIEDAAYDLYVNRLLQILAGSSWPFLAAFLGFLFGSEALSDTGFRIDPDGFESDLLDKIGKIVGQPRDGFNNGSYALLISARIQANRSNGRRDSLLLILTLLNGNQFIYAKDVQPATIILQTTLTINPYYIAQRFLAKAVAAGVKFYLYWSSAPPDHTLTWGSTYGWDDVLTEDPGSEYEAGGGIWAGAATGGG